MTKVKLLKQNEPMISATTRLCLIGISGVGGAVFSNYALRRGLTTFFRMAIASLFLLSYSPRVRGRRVLSEFCEG